jgi:hypothetical protein
MFDPSTPHDQRQENLSILAEVAQSGITQAKSAGDDATVEQLLGLYERTAAYLKLYAERQEAEAAFREADAALRTQRDAPRYGHATDVNLGKMLEERGMVIVSPDLFDALRDPAELRAGAAAFEALAAACR